MEVLQIKNNGYKNPLAYSILGGKMNDNLFKRVENKTNVNKETILGLANKLSNGNMKNRETLMEVINELSSLTGRSVSEEKKSKIVNAIVNDKVPKDVDKSF